MKENKIRLPNRYNNEVYLEKIKDNKYKLIHRSPYIKLVTIDGVKDKYNFIDISGGPMISLKDKLSVGVVKSISMSDDSYIIEVET